MRKLLIGIPLLLLLPGMKGCEPKKNAWSELTSPTQGPSRAIGSYSAGCLQGAVSLAPDGKGYQLVRLTRRRFYGHKRLVDFIIRFGEELDRKKLGPVLVGDMSQPRGGPTLTGHKSHQIGLDVDIWFWHPEDARIRSLDMDERERTSAISMVDGSGLKVKAPTFGAREERLLRIASSHPDVDRIFVNAAIKKELCARAGKRKEKRAWLAKIRPWWGHDYHFHVRLKCPLEDPYCEKQTNPPMGHGCDASLDWWFSQEARGAPPAEESEPKPKKQPELPKLPADCKIVQGL